jgi:hypothetical protein
MTEQLVKPEMYRGGIVCRRLERILHAIVTGTLHTPGCHPAPDRALPPFRNSISTSPSIC